MGWVSNGMTDRPTRGVILADTGAMSVLTNVPVTISTWATRTSVLIMAKRNATNDADVNTHPLYCQPGSKNHSFPSMTFALGERLVVRCRDDVDDQIQVTITW